MRIDFSELLTPVNVYLASICGVAISQENLQIVAVYVANPHCKQQSSIMAQTSRMSLMNFIFIRDDALTFFR